MKVLNVTDFREQCLALIDSLPRNGIVITRRGKPVAKLIPFREEVNNASLIGSMKGQFEIKGNIFSTDVKWDAES